MLGIWLEKRKESKRMDWLWTVSVLLLGLGIAMVMS